MLHRYRFKLATAALILVIQTGTGTPALAADEEILQRIQSAYAAKDIMQVIELGKRLKEKSLASATAHYIVGNCYMSNLNTDEARRHYEYCRMIQPSSHVAAYATQALAAMSMPYPQKKTPAEPSTAPKKTAAPSPEAPKSGAAKEVADSEHMQKRVETQLTEIHSKRDQELLDTLTREQKEQELRIKRLSDDVQQQIDQVPKFYYDYRNRQYPNPDYNSICTGIRESAATQMASLQTEANHLKQKIEALQKTSQAVIDKEKADAASQTNLGNSTIKVTPHGSDAFVKNYTNYSNDPQEVPMKPDAGLQKLNVSNPKSQKQANKQGK